jgi:hypothetical protein
MRSRASFGVLCLGVDAINSATSRIAVAHVAGEVAVDQVDLLQHDFSVTNSKDKKKQGAGHKHGDAYLALAALRQNRSKTNQIPENPLDGLDISVIHPPIFDHSHDEDYEVGCFLTDDRLFCMQGPFHDFELRHSLTRASPMSQFIATSMFYGNVECADIGYTVEIQEEHDCWGSVGASTWGRPGNPANRIEYGLPAGGSWAAELDHYDSVRGFTPGTSRQWADCMLCGGNLEINEASCANWNEDVAAGIHAAGEIASLVSVGGSACFEGTREYMEQMLEDTLTTPLGVVFEGNSVVVGESCASRGYEDPRDFVDECWPNAGKWLPIENHEQHMIAWIVEYMSAIVNFDASEYTGHWTTMDWVSCRACQAGGAVRDRGLWLTMHGGDSVPYTREYCSSTDFPSL